MELSHRSLTQRWANAQRLKNISKHMVEDGLSKDYSELNSIENTTCENWNAVKSTH